VRGRAAQVLPPIAFGVLFLAAWEGFVSWRDIQPFVLPAPSAIWDQLKLGQDQILTAAWATGQNALIGLGLGVVLGILLALVASRVRILDELTTPLAVAVATMPIVALTPIFNTMFASTSTIPRRLIVLIAAFFPIFVNTLRGLRETQPVHEELMRAYAATPTQATRVLRLPAALPFVFTGLRIAASGAVIAAVVSEYFGGLQRGLGPAITTAAASGGYPRAWAYVVAAIGLGLIAYLTALALERIVMPWNRSQETP
jgi:NitT/TauT family transport system permease protein